MAERIYILGRKGWLEGLRENTFGLEGDLQELVADHPEVIDEEQIRPNDARRWILLAREKGIAETSDAGARWSLDHLIIDQDARPTLAEAKLRDNSYIHRKIVGQTWNNARCGLQPLPPPVWKAKFEVLMCDPVPHKPQPPTLSIPITRPARHLLQFLHRRYPAGSVRFPSFNPC